MEVKGKKIEGTFYRECRLQKKAVDEQSRSVELSFSSEEPYQRWFGTEILGHDPKEVRMVRMEGGDHPLLLQHDTDRQIGVIERAWLDQGDRKGRAIVRFAPPTNRLAEEVYQDVLAGIRSLVSVGYRVHRFKDVTERDKDGEPTGPETARAVDWEPYEVSIVSIPADNTVGVGKEQKTEEPAGNPEQQHHNEVSTRTMETELKAPATDKERVALEEKQARDRAEAEAKMREEKLELIKKQADQRVKEIYAIAARFNAHSLREQAIAEDWPVDKFRAMVMESMDSGIVVKQATTETGNSGKTLGEIFVTSPQYRELGGRIGQRRTISMELPHESFFQRATFSATDYTLTSIQKLPGVPGLLDQQQINVSQLFAQGTTSALTIRYIKESSFTNAAAAVLEEGSYAAASLPVAESDATVHKVGVYLKTTDEMLADHDGMRSFIDGRLAYMVGIKEDNYLLNGTGSSQITGILNVSGINTVDRGTYPTVADAIGQALNKVRSVGFIEPDAIILHPNDWTDLILSKDSNGQYYAGGPFTGAYGVGGYSNVGRMFGLPVVVTSQITEGTGLVGSFRMGAQVFRRAGITIEASNAEASYFITGSVAVRAQSRMTLACYKPLAFCSITSIE